MATASTRIDDLEDEQLIEAAGTLHEACLAGDYDPVRSILLAHPPSDGIPLAALQDSDGFTALHAAAENGDTRCVELLLSYKGGAQWAMPDNCGHTAGDVAFSAQRTDAYQLIHDHAVRTLLLQNALSSRAPESDPGDDDRPMSNNPKAFLPSRLRFSRSLSGPCCVDADGNGVMMGWETPLMDRTADVLCYAKGLEVLNVGFGLGIIDSAFQRHKPSRHVIVEPHPDVLRYLCRVWLPSHFPTQAPGVLASDDDTPVEDLFDDPETKRRLNALDIEVYRGRWQDFVESEMCLGSTFDVVYWDTFSEDYSALVDFIPSIPSILAGPESRWSFFHGLGADSRLLYDVYTTLVEAEIRDAGMSVEWEDVEVPDLGEVEWGDVVKRYWDIPAPYRLAICRAGPCDET